MGGVREERYVPGMVRHGDMEFMEFGTTESDLNGLLVSLIEMKDLQHGRDRTHTAVFDKHIAMERQKCKAGVE
jgi:hypothetical protein